MEVVSVTRFQALSLLLGLLFALLLLGASFKGPDFEQYLDWARAAQSGNIFEIQGDTGSPMGVPLSQWSHGPGMFFVLPKLVLGEFISFSQAAYVMGWLGSLVFWWALFKILNRAAGGNVPLTCFGAGAAFLGTHAGVYSLEIASESSAYPFAAVLALWIITVRNWRMRDLLLVGAAAGMLINIRWQLALYAVPALAAAAMGAFPEWKNKPWSLIIPGSISLLGPPAVATIQWAWTNHWMTGSFFQSPHSFGDGVFKSVDWLNPEIFAILFHPWHGLLVYHPLYALCFIALIARFIQTSSRPERLILGMIAFITTFHLYLHASWYGWWLGTRTFGVRGVSLFAVVLLPVLIHTIAQTRNRALRRKLIFLSCLACLWSYMMLGQMVRQFLTYEDLFTAARKWFQSMLFHPKAAVFILGFLLFLVLRREFAPGKRDPHRDIVVEIAAILLGIVSLKYLILRWTSTLILSGTLPESLHPSTIWIWDMVEVLFMLAIAVMIYFLCRSWRESHPALERAAPWVGWGTVVVFFGSLIIFFSLAVQTEKRILSREKPEREFTSIRGFHLEEVYRTFKEYQRVPGFAGKKAALRNFLEANGVAAKKLAPP